MTKKLNKDYQPIYNTEDIKLGKISSYIYKNDPTHLLFCFARYKFVAKMFKDFENVLEIGFGDGFFSPIVKSVVKKLDGYDNDAIFSDFFKKNNIYSDRINFEQKDVLTSNPKKKYDGIFSLDTFGHIKPKDVDKFMKFIIKASKTNSACIIGMPSSVSQKYASKLSKKGHVNCMNGPELKKNMQKYFSNCFVFSMNDEVVHTGFYPMAHYLLALCTNPKY